MLELLALLASQFAMTSVPPREVLEMFEHRRHPYAATSYHDGHLSYSLFRPQRIVKGKEYPLIVWLHGHGKVELEEEYGHLNNAENILGSKETADRAQFFLLAIQCPQDQQRFYASPQRQQSDAQSTVSTPGDATVEIINELLREEPISKDQITIVGISAGGPAAWEMAVRNPTLFAAIAPLSGGHGTDTGELSSLRDVSVWAFNSSSEPSSVEKVSHSIDGLKSIGGSAELTVIQTNTHFCWCSAFADYELLEWLVAQKRGSWLSPKPGSIPWRWHTWAVAVGAPILVAVAIQRERRRRTALPALETSKRK